MKARILLLLISFFVFVDFGSALKCYLCVGSPNSDCAKSKTFAMVEDSCKSPREYILKKEHPLLKHVYPAEEEVGDIKSYCLMVNNIDPEFKPAAFIRSCVAFPDNVNDPCEFIKQHVKVKWCKVCNTDLCNKRVYDDGEDANPIINMVF